MSSIKAQIDRYTHVVLDDEDGDPMGIGLSPPATKQALERLHKRVGEKIPSQLMELLKCADGLDFFGQSILPIDEQVFFEPPGIIAIHNWGNGDFDCIAVKSSHAFREGSIVFMNHSPSVTALVAESLAEWFESAFTEIKAKGTLLHPGDYRQHPVEGVYSGVLSQLLGRDCELNR